MGHGMSLSSLMQNERVSRREHEELKPCWDPHLLVPRRRSSTSARADAPQRLADNPRTRKVMATDRASAQSAHRRGSRFTQSGKT